MLVVGQKTGTGSARQEELSVGELESVSQPNQYVMSYGERKSGEEYDYLRK